MTSATTDGFADDGVSIYLPQNLFNIPRLNKPRPRQRNVSQLPQLPIKIRLIVKVLNKTRRLPDDIQIIR
jgi:hypothetical protein